MKTLLILIIACCTAGASEVGGKMGELKVSGGKTYVGVTIRKIEPDGISIMHESGTAKVKFSEMEEEVRKQFGYDPAAAAEHAALVAEARREAALREAARREAYQEKIRDAAFKELLRKAGREVWLEVIQNAGDYSLCRWGEIEKFPVMDHSGLSPKIKGYSKAKGEEQETWIAVYGLGGVVDKDEWIGTLYPAGNVSYESVGGGGRTVSAWATTVEAAASR